MHSHLLHLHSVQGFVYHRFREGFLYWQGRPESLKASELLQGHHRIIRKLGLACHTLVTLRRLHYIIRQLCHPKDSEFSERETQGKPAQKGVQIRFQNPTGMKKFSLRPPNKFHHQSAKKMKNIFFCIQADYCGGIILPTTFITY